MHRGGKAQAEDNPQDMPTTLMDIRENRFGKTQDRGLEGGDTHAEAVP